jgi:hypothetical protein
MQALTAATALASEHSGRAEVEHARLAELEGLLEAKHKELEEAQVRPFYLLCIFNCWLCAASALMHGLIVHGDSSTSTVNGSLPTGSR